MPQQNNYLLTREGKMVAISDDELYHWKYIKREKVNGKWRYYYKDDFYDREKQKATAKIQSAINAGFARGASLEEYEKAKKDYDNSGYTVTNLVGNDSYGYRYESKTYRDPKLGDKLWSVHTNKISQDLAYDGTVREAVKGVQTLKAVERYVKKKRAYKVADLLNKSSDAIDKAKSWVSNLFKKKKKSK